MELPFEEPLRYCKRKYGRLITAAEVLLIIAALALAGWFVYRAVAAGEWDVPAAIGALGFAASAYITSVVRKMHHDLNELKNKFR